MRAVTAVALVSALALCGCGGETDADAAVGDASPSDGAEAGLDGGGEGGSDGSSTSDGEVDGGDDPVGFVPAASLAGARSSHTATLLADGRVLVVGGESVRTRDPLDSVEIYDPAADSWSAGPALPEPRSNHVAVRLGDGRVLVAGGGRSAPIGVPSGEGVVASALLFDPDSGSWSPTGDLAEGRSHFSAALLPSGRVLVAGGGAGTHEHGSTCTGAPDCGPIADTLGTAEIFDPDSETFSSTGAMAEPRYLHTLTFLDDGRVVAVAGANDYQESFASTEVFDETAGLWSPGPNLASRDRLFHAAALLPSGRVLVGGGKQSNVTFLDSVVLVDVAADTSEVTASLSVPHTAGVFVRLVSGRILSVAGFRCPSPCEPIAEAEIYDESTGVWSAIEPLASARAGHTATLLADGRVLVAGGYGSLGDLSSCELTQP